jgi:phosphohistidine phosphatase
VQVVLIRHADTVVETLALPDPARYLSPLGRRQARDLADRLRERGCVPTQVWTSPLVRTVQTAELLIAALGWNGDVISQPDLAPNGDVRAIERAIAALDASAIVVIVGHEPALSGLAGVLASGANIAALRRAAATCIEDGRIAWHASHDNTHAM